MQGPEPPYHSSSAPGLTRSAVGPALPRTLGLTSNHVSCTTRSLTKTMHRKLLRAFVTLARHATTLALLGLLSVAAGVVGESMGFAFVGLSVLVIGRLAQIVQTRRYEKKRHKAEVRNKYKTLVGEHWKLTPPPKPATTPLAAGAGLPRTLAAIEAFVPSSPQPFYADWQFWSAIAAVIAIVLSQLPPVRLWFRPRRLEVEVHSRVQITHKVGNPNLGMYVSVRNTGGRELRVRSLQISLSRDGTSLGSLPAQNYFETASSQSTVLFVPFSLKPGETWAHGTNFLHLFDRATEKLYRASESFLGAEIRRKLDARPENDKRAVVADPLPRSTIPYAL